MRLQLLAATLLTTAACGLSASGDVMTAGRDDVPYDLLAPEPRQTTTTLPDLSSTTVRVWLVAADRLVPLMREVRRPLSAGGSLDALLHAPSIDETSLGVRNAVRADTIADIDIVDDIVTIALAPSFKDAPQREQLLALGQIVYTLTELDGVAAARFALDGVPVEVPRGDGSLTDDPVTRFDFRILVGQRASARALSKDVNG